MESGMVTPPKRVNLQRILEEFDLPLLEVENVLFSTYKLWNSDVLNGNTPIMIYSAKTEGPNSINDPRLGVIGGTGQCQTCNLSGEDCVGHLGLIKLAKPIINPVHMKTVIDILSSLCRGCARPLISLEKIKELELDKLPPKAMLDEISKLSIDKEYVCTNLPEEDEIQCSTIIPYKYKRDKDTISKKKVIYYRQYYNDKHKLETEKTAYQMPISTDDLDKESVKKFLDSIDDEYARMLGFDVDAGSHPRNLIIQYLIVMPPCSRTNSIVNGHIESDKLGRQYLTIIKTNNNIQKMIDAKESPGEIDDQMGKLSEHITKLMVDKGEKSHFKSIYTLLGSGKKGMLRGKMLGTRADQTGRSVAVNDSDLKFYQVGIPKRMAETLTYPVIVNNQNKENLTKLLRAGKVVSINPSTKSVFSQYHYNRKRVNQKIRDTYNLTNGDVVHRQLQNGDYVIVNRQPTLHAAGMLGMEVVLIPVDDMVIRVNILVTSPFNLDFDGDELNIHVPQTPEAQQQVKDIMGVKNCLRGGEKGQLNIKLVYKSLETVAELTRDATDYDPEIEIGREWLTQIINIIFDENFNIRFVLDKFDDRLRKIGFLKEGESVYGPHASKKISGKLLFSILLPDDFNYNYGGVLIKDGILLKGVITKKHIGGGYNTISNLISVNYGDEVYINFIQNLFDLLNEWGRMHALSVGFEDCFITNPKSKELLDKTVSDIRIQVQRLRQRMTGNPFEDAKIEQKIIEQIDKFGKVGTRVLNEESKRNPFRRMIDSGAKGSMRNYMKITSGFGQVYSMGGIPRPEMSKGEKYTPYQFADIVELEDTGFTADPLVRGLDPVGVFYNQRAGIEGLLKGISKTPETGQIFRELRIYLKSLITHPDGSVRDGYDNIVQGTYGDDQFDPAKIAYIREGSVVKTFFTYINLLVGQVKSTYGGLSKKLNKKQIEEIVNQYDPIKSVYRKNSDVITSMFKAELRKKIEIIEIPPIGFDMFKRELRDKFYQKIVKVNRSVGSLVSESLTGDLTQDALDGKKNTGTSKYRVTPLDLLKEILSVTKNSKSPATNLYFKTPNASFDYIQSKETDIIQLSFNDVVKEYDVPTDVGIFMKTYEHEWYQEYESLHGMKMPDSQWMVRTNLDLNMLYKYQLYPSDICQKLREQKLFECYLSPIMGGQNDPYIYLDIYVIDEVIFKVKKKIPKLSKLQSKIIPYIYLKEIFIPKDSKELVLRGVKDILDYVIDSVEIDDFFTVENMVSPGKWRIYINYGWLNYNLIDYNQIVSFLKEIGLKIIKTETSYIEIASKRRPSEIARERYNELSQKEEDYITAKQNENKKLTRTVIKVKPPTISNGTDTLFRKYYVTVTGNNFAKFLLFGYFDLTRTYSDDLHETYKYLGVTATRNLIIIRIQRIFIIADLPVDPRHILLLANYMTFNGDINKIGHFGAVKRGAGIFATASLGNVGKVFTSASTFGLKDSVGSVPTAVVTGTRIKQYYDETTKQVTQPEDEEMDIDELNNFLDNFDLMEEELLFDPEAEVEETTTPVRKEQLSSLMIGTGILED